MDPPEFKRSNSYRRWRYFYYYFNKENKLRFFYLRKIKKILIIVKSIALIIIYLF